MKLTFSQLMSSGSGPGMGFGMSSGLGAVGIFGGLPAMFGIDKAGEGRDGKRMVGRSGRASSPAGGNPDDSPDSEVIVPGRGGGLNEGGVPIRYRRKVGQYFISNGLPKRREKRRNSSPL